MQKKIHGNTHRAVDTALRSLARSLEAQGNWAEAEEAYREALEVRRKLYGADNPYTPTLVSDLARTLQAQRKQAEATSIYREVLEMQKKMHGNTHRAVDTALGNLARCLEAEGKLAEAEAVWREELDVEKRLSGELHPFVANSVMNLARILTAAGKYAEVAAVFREELDRARAADGKGWSSTNSGLGLLLHHFAELLWEQKAFKEARSAAEEAWALYQQHPEWSGNERGHAYRVLHAMLTELSDQPALESLQRNWLAYERGKLPPEDPQLAGVLAQLTLNLLAQQRFTEAEATAREALTIRAKTSPDDWQTFNSRSQLGGSLLGQKKYTEAEPLLLSGYEGMKQREAAIPPQGKVRIQETLQRLVQLHEATGQPEKAAEWSKKLAEFDRVGAEKSLR